MNGRRTTGRMVRKDAPRLRLEERDEYALHVIHRARVLRTADLVPLVFPSLVVARRRLRRLHDAGYVALFVDRLEESNRITLDSKGYRLLGVATPKGYTPRAGESLREVATHAQTVTRFWCLLAASCPDAGVRLARFRFERELVVDHLNTLTTFRPDAVAQLVHGDVTGGVLVEVDCATESPNVVARKLHTFARLRATRTAVAGVAADVLVLLAPTQRRLASIARATGTCDAVMARVFHNRSDSLSLTTGWMSLSSIIAGSPVSAPLLSSLTETVATGASIPAPTPDSETPS